MKFTSFFVTGGAILITGVSLSSSRVLPTVQSSTDINFVGDIPKSHDGPFDRYEPLKIRGIRHSKISTTPKSLNKDPTRPPGLEGPLESKFWKDMKDHIASPAFNNLKPTDELTLYTGANAWGSVERFETAFEEAFPGRTIRHYINVIKSDVVLQGLIETYKAEPQGKKWTLPNGIASYDLVMLTRNRAKPVHIFFANPEVANAAVRGKIPNGHLKYFEIFPITSRGTKVTEIFAWDLHTFEENLKKGNGYKPPRIWKRGDQPLGKRVDFTEDSLKRLD